MHNDAITAAGTPRAVKLGGEEHALSPLMIGDLGHLQGWVDRQFGDPFDVVNAEIARNPGRYNTAQQQHLFRIALEISRAPKPLIGTPDADELLRTVEGVKEILYHAVRKAEPGFTRDDAARVYASMTIGDVARVFALTSLELVMTDPKAAGDGTPGPTTGAAGTGPSTGGAPSTPSPGGSRGRRRRRSRG
jgi:hypothetical protein